MMSTESRRSNLQTSGTEVPRIPRSVRTLLDRIKLKNTLARESFMIAEMTYKQSLGKNKLPELYYGSSDEEEAPPKKSVSRSEDTKGGASDVDGSSASVPSAKSVKLLHQFQTTHPVVKLPTFAPLPELTEKDFVSDSDSD